MAEEKELIVSACNDDKEAFFELAKKHAADIYNFCLYLTQNRSDAEDLSQEVFIKAFKAIKSFKQKSAFSTWLHAIAINQHKDRLRHNKILKFVSIDRLFHSKDGEKLRLELPDRQKSAENQLESSELKEIIAGSLDKLAPEQKIPIVLKYIEGKSLEEIAEICGCSVGTMSSRISRGIKTLRILISGS
ncbi:MAG: hypothetical protein A2252_05705 [Elusimicrobia bacterium RIFOXYA2_FULL_39_19]|nr:MAG: hypothetical protein A2252_05705 [Elusimicrobia bacterium RIFOXYA2_FULL_39_19]